jgi:5'-3' exonuclease
MVRVDSEGKMWPVGHVSGVLRIVQELSFQYKVVLLAVDSVASWRHEVLPGYKSGRHQVTGDPFEDYKIMNDLLNILKICTFRKNVFYIKKDGCEADDILATYIASSTSDSSKEWSLCFNDNDVLQTPGNYYWFNRFGNPPVDRRGYILEKYGLDLDFLPVQWKVVRGDSSDKIPVAIPRFSSKNLVQMCYDLKDSRSFDDMVSWLQSANLSKAFDWVKEQVRDSGSDLYKTLETNWSVVCPKIVDINEFRLKRFVSPLQEIQDLLSYYQLQDYTAVE